VKSGSLLRSLLYSSTDQPTYPPELNVNLCFPESRPSFSPSSPIFFLSASRRIAMCTFLFFTRRREVECLYFPTRLQSPLLPLPPLERLPSFFCEERHALFDPAEKLLFFGVFPLQCDHFRSTHFPPTTTHRPPSRHVAYVFSLWDEMSFISFFNSLEP